MQILDRVIFGKTGLNVTVAGLGCGGQSRLGLRRGASKAQAIGVVLEAVTLGINYIDTAHSYGTEEIVGTALEGHPNEVVLSTKIRLHDAEGALIDAGILRRGTEESLRRLRTGSIDVMHLHGLTTQDFTYAMDELVPELERLRRDGLIRYLAVSEGAQSDPDHEMLQSALDADCFDVILVGFGLFFDEARSTVLSKAITKDVGVAVMFAAQKCIDRINAYDAAGNSPALSADDRRFLIEAAYRYARHEPGCHVILAGTGNVEHLRQNIASISAAALSEPELERLRVLSEQLKNAGAAS